MSKLNIGCGPNVFPGWVNLDREDPSQYLAALKTMGPEYKLPDTQRKLADALRAGVYVDFRIHDLRRGFLAWEDNSVDLIYLGQVIEHLNPIYEAPSLLKECHRMLKPGGVLRIATPDYTLLMFAWALNQMDTFAVEQPEFYAKASKDAKLAYIMYGSCGPKSTWDHYEGHMMIYTEESLTDAVVAAGFPKDAVLMQMAGHSVNPVMREEVVDTGVSHSLFLEAVK